MTAEYPSLELEKEHSFSLSQAEQLECLVAYIKKCTRLNQRMSSSLASKESQLFSTGLRHFVSNEKWIFAKTYAKTWPHEYIVRAQVDEQLFIKLVEHIRANGYQGHFYKKEITYYDEDGLVYWTMGAPVEETTIINRCRKEQTYEYRLAHNDLPS